MTRFSHFYQRKATILKKAHELATMRGAEIAVMIFSPSGKQYVYGFPNFDTIKNRFLNMESNDDLQDCTATTNLTPAIPSSSEPNCVTYDFNVDGNSDNENTLTIN